MLTRLEVDGFKSLRDFSIDLEPLTVLLGPNDAGKSNILEALALSSRLAHARGRAQARARPGARPVSARGYTSRFGDRAKPQRPTLDKAIFVLIISVLLIDAACGLNTFGAGSSASEGTSTVSTSLESTNSVDPPVTTTVSASTEGTVSGTDSSTTSAEDLLPPCDVPGVVISDDFTDINLRCAVDQVAAGRRGDCIFTCAEAQGIGELSAPNLGIEKTVGIRHLVNLAELDLNSNLIEVLDDFHALTSLRSLYLYSNKIGSAKGLAALPALTGLYLNANWITSCEELPASPALVVLELSSNQIASLDGFPELGQLKDLYLGNNAGLGEASLKILETQTPKLEELHIQSIGIKSPLLDFPDLLSLRTLNLGENPLLDGLGELPIRPTLTDLQVYKTGMSVIDLNVLPKRFPNLLRLDFSGNSVSSLDKFPLLPKLTQLLLPDNAGLSSVPQLSDSTPALQFLDIRDDKFGPEGLADLLDHKWLGADDEINIAGNPYTCDDPSMLQILDDFALKGVAINPVCTP